MPCLSGSKTLHDDSSTKVDKIQDFTEFENDIANAFVCLVAIITQLLEKTKLEIIKMACFTQINTPNGAKLSHAVVKQINSAKDLYELLKILHETPYWSWIDLRLLEALVIASGSATAKKNVENYKDAVFSKKLNEVLPYILQKKIRDKFFAKIVCKINKDADEVTVADLIDIQCDLEKVIMGIGDGTFALEHFENGCIKIYSCIPNYHAERVYHAASSQLHKFCDLDLIYLKIGTYPKMVNPSHLMLKPRHLLDTAGKIMKCIGQIIISCIFRYYMAAWVDLSIESKVSWKQKNNTKLVLVGIEPGMFYRCPNYFAMLTRSHVHTSTHTHS